MVTIAVDAIGADHAPKPEVEGAIRFFADRPPDARADHALHVLLRERGLGLQAGQAVITGSYAGVLELPLGRQLQIGFGALGILPIRFIFSE